MLYPFLKREAFRLDRMDFSGRRVGQTSRRERAARGPRVQATLSDRTDHQSSTRVEDTRPFVLETPESQRRVRFAPDIIVHTIPSREDEPAALEDGEDSDDSDDELEEMGAYAAKRGPLTDEEDDVREDMGESSDDDDDDGADDGDDTAGLPSVLDGIPAPFIVPCATLERIPFLPVRPRASYRAPRPV